jgi:hypothetical protein
MKSNTLKIISVTLLALALSSAVHAVPISGEIHINSHGTPPVINMADDTVNFAGPGTNAVVNFGVGDYSGKQDIKATYVDFDYTAFVGPQTIWTLVDGSAWFVLSAITSITETANGLVLLGNGTASLEGFDDTPGVWSFSADRARSTASFNFSSTTTVVPDGGTTAALLGLSLVGVSLIARRRRTA